MAFRKLILTLFLLSTTSGISSAFMVYIDAEDAGDLSAPLEVREKKGRVRWEVCCGTAGSRE